MTDNLPITVLGESEGTNSRCSSLEVIGLELDILGEPLNFSIGAARSRARLADIVPTARTLSTKLAMAVLDRLRRDERFVPCCKGCSACCNYLIPLSVPEVFRLREEVLAMSLNDGRAAWQACLDAAKKILDNKRANFGVSESTKTNGQTQLSRVSRWYAGLKLPCPFLSGGLCTAYEQRPTACREHIVTDSALLCQTEGADAAQAVRMPVSILDALVQMTAELEQSTIEAVMLPLALPWAEENLQRHQRTWSAVTMVERFVEIVKTMATKNSTPLVGSTLHSG